MSDDKSVVSLYELLLRHFNLDELRTLCFRLGIDFDSVEGSAKAGKARELLLDMNRRGRLNELVDEVQLMRPDVKFELPGSSETSSASAAQAADSTPADGSRLAEDVTGVLASFVTASANGVLPDDQREFAEGAYELILFFAQLEENEYLAQTLKRFEENPEKRQAVFQSTLLESLEESPLFLQTLAGMAKAKEGDEAGRAVFKTDISGGEVGQVINIDKLEGGLNINSG